MVSLQTRSGRKGTDGRAVQLLFGKVTELWESLGSGIYLPTYLPLGRYFLKVTTSSAHAM